MNSSYTKILSEKYIDYHYSLPVTLIVAVTRVDAINNVHSIVIVPAVTEAPGIVAVAVNMELTHCREKSSSTGGWMSEDQACTRTIAS